MKSKPSSHDPDRLYALTRPVQTAAQARNLLAQAPRLGLRFDRLRAVGGLHRFK
jgi:hypothetical protein